MAIRRRRTVRKRSGKKQWYQRRYSALELAGKAWRATKYIRGLVNSEMLHKHTSGQLNITNTGSVISLNAIAQNDTDAGRTGNSIFARNLLLNFDIKVHANSLSPNFCKIMLFQDTQQQGDTAPTVSDVLLGPYPNSPLNNAQFGRFQVIKTWKFTLDQVQKTAKMISKYMKLWTHIRYNGTADTDIQKGGLYILFISDQASDYPTCDYQTRLGYHDN